MKPSLITVCFIVLIVTLSAQTLPTPTITALGNTLSCDGNGLVLQSSATTGNLWSNGLTTQTIHVMNTGTYNVTQVTGTNSSASSAPISVSLAPSASLTQMAPICLNPATVSPINMDIYANPPGGYWSNSAALVGNMFDPLKANLGPNNVVIYWVMYHDGNNMCVDSTSMRITVQNCTSLLDNNKETAIKVFPNPGYGHYVLQSSTSLTEIKVFNLLGEEIKAVVLKNDSQFTINIPDPAGVYLLQYKYEQKTSVSRIVKLN